MEATKSMIVRNMGNFNLFFVHVLPFFHHEEQCCYPSLLVIPHIPVEWHDGQEEQGVLMGSSVVRVIDLLITSFTWRPSAIT